MDKKELFLDLPKEKFAVIGNLRTIYGINLLIKNILANPRVRYIVVCGEDLMKTGNIIVNFFINGISEDYQVIGTQAYIDRNIPRDAIETLRKNVRVIDLRDEKNLEKLKEKISNILNEISREEELFSKPMVIGEKEREELNKIKLIAGRLQGAKVKGGIVGVVLPKFVLKNLLF